MSLIRERRIKGNDQQTRKHPDAAKLPVTTLRAGPAFAPLMTALFAVILAGCATREKVRYEPVNNKPILGDDAMTMRQWPSAHSYYPNGAVAAWSTRFPLATDPNRPQSQNLILEPVLFIGQTLTLPLEFIANPPFRPVVYHGAEYRPTYTFQPPLPPRGGAAPQGGMVGYGAAGPSMQSGGGGYGAGGAAGR